MPTESAILPFEGQSAFEAWLEGNFAMEEGIWLRFYKKASGIPTITYDEAVESALCYGWIDGQKKGYDEVSYLLRFTPRRKRSMWSKVNVGKVGRLTAEGRMRPSGIAKVEAAKADGRWERAYESQSGMTVPDDLLAALDANHKAAEAFAALKAASRYAILWRVHTVKRAETRERKISEFVAMLERGEAVHPVL